jgi:hypothetical protein
MSIYMKVVSLNKRWTTFIKLDFEVFK